MENPHLFHALILKVWSLSQSISKTWALARNANMQAPEICFKKPCRGSDVHCNAFEKHKKRALELWFTSFQKSSLVCNALFEHNLILHQRQTLLHFPEARVRLLITNGAKMSSKHSPWPHSVHPNIAVAYNRSSPGISPHKAHTSALLSVIQKQDCQSLTL